MHYTLGKMYFLFLPMKTRCCRHYSKMISGNVSFDKQCWSLSRFIFCSPASPVLQYLFYQLSYSRMKTFKKSQCLLQKLVG